MGEERKEEERATGTVVAADADLVAAVDAPVGAQQSKAAGKGLRLKVAIHHSEAVCSGQIALQRTQAQQEQKGDEHQRRRCDSRTVRHGGWYKSK